MDPQADGRLGGSLGGPFGQLLGRSLDGPSVTVALTAAPRQSLGRSLGFRPLDCGLSATSPGRALGPSLGRALAPLSNHIASRARNGEWTEDASLARKRARGLGRFLQRGLASDPAEASLVAAKEALEGPVRRPYQFVPIPRVAGFSSDQTRLLEVGFGFGPRPDPRVYLT